MYGELVKSLRNMSKMGMKYGMAAVKMHEAADAIEQLCGLTASQSKDCSEAVAKYLELWAKQPRWIPVSERLPEAWEEVMLQFPKIKRLVFLMETAGGVFLAEMIFTPMLPQKKCIRHIGRRSSQSRRRRNEHE